MEENKDTQFEEFEVVILERRKLLPLWIKIFCWIFMIFGIFSLGALFFGVLGYDIDLSFYGFETRQPLSLIGLGIISMLAFKGFTAYSLWFEKDYAITFGKIDAILGIIICIASMIIQIYIEESSVVHMRIEIIFLILYFRKLSKIQEQWKS